MCNTAKEMSEYFIWLQTRIKRVEAYIRDCLLRIQADALAHALRKKSVRETLLDLDSKLEELIRTYLYLRKDDRMQKDNKSTNGKHAVSKRLEIDETVCSDKLKSEPMKPQTSALDEKFSTALIPAKAYVRNTAWELEQFTRTIKTWRLDVSAQVYMCNLFFT